MPDPNRQAKEQYPIERLEDGLANLKIDDVMTLPAEKWQRHTDHALSVERFGKRSAWFRVKIPPLEGGVPNNFLVATIQHFLTETVDFYSAVDGKIISRYMTGFDRARESTRESSLYYSFDWPGLFCD